MKAPLRISIFFNAFLVGTLMLVLAHRPVQIPAAIPATAPSASEIANRPQSIQAAPPFHWSQLEATNDYQIYIANLRAVGCPEASIRAIVTADMEAACAFERRQLEATSQGTERFSPEIARQTAARLLAETSTTASGQSSDKTSAIPAHSNLQATTVNAAAAERTVKASYPLALQNAVLNDSNLSDSQKAAVRQVQQEFLAALGGSDQNPDDPAYGARWQSAQTDADDALRAKLGNQAYLGYQLQHYASNFQQVMLNAGDGPVTINPEALAR